MTLGMDTLGAVSRLLYAIAGRSWAWIEQRTLNGIEMLGIRATPDGSTPVDAVLVDLTTGGVDVLEASATLASATTVNLGSVKTKKVTITGSANISSFGPGAQLERLITFTDGGSVLTYNATSLKLPTLASITTRAGDTCHATQDPAGNWHIHDYTRADGTPLSLGGALRFDAVQSLNGSQLGQLLTNSRFAELFPRIDIATQGLSATQISNALTNLGVSTFVKTLLDDADASTALPTLGISDFIKTLLDDANQATALQTLGAQPADADLTAIAALATTAVGRSLLTLVDAVGARSYFGGLYPTRGFAAEGSKTDFTDNNACTNPLGVDLVATGTRIFGYATADFTNSSGVAVDVQARLVVANITAGGTTVAVGRSQIITLPAVAYTGSGKLNPMIQVNGLTPGTTYRLQL
ncbi:hypothetical protein [Methylobacterium brachythecii]|uniref:Uncharacterized protein n=1 Tax=Methylobacterium brachythecii TaxID=1176177 RepID=A0A7W6AN01_9HYPH|nr:hypothetical protein [Methylobacterium brachythecii]MBB3905578.1 hypothetical protein [Methylobacterium brachythecii]